MSNNEEENKNFEELGLDPRLIRALNKKSIQKPTLIQQEAIPLILQGKDVVARAKTGSGKTFAYLLPMLHRLFTDLGTNENKNKSAPSVFVLVPTRELSQQVFKELLSLIELCRAVQLKAVQLTSSMSASDMRSALGGKPDIMICTPACIPKCLSIGALQSKNINDSLDFLVLDEADLLLSYGYEDDLKSLTAHIPRRCQCLLMSATSSDDVDKLKNLILHNSVILTLSEVGDMKDDTVPKNVEQFWISCKDRDKLLYILTLMKLELVQKKVLIFTNTIDTGFRLRLFLEKFGIKSAVLNSELPQNSRLHILEEFNAGLFDYLIATDVSQKKEKEQANKESKAESNKSKKHAKKALDTEFGVGRGIDFKHVQTVINFDFPESVAGYVHRIGRTGRGYNTGQSISLVSTNEMEVFDEVKSFLGDDEEKELKVIVPFPLLTDNAVESLRYRAEDVAKSVTKIAVREARAQDLRNEILNSEKLKAHFEANPKDLDLLKHDKILSKNPAAPHLRDVPDYLVDRTTMEASKIVKLKKEAMGNTRFPRDQGSKKRSRRNKDPLKFNLSTEGRKRGRKGGMKREGEGGDKNNRRKKNKTES